MKKLKLFSLALMALFATSLWADTKTYNFNGTNPLSEWSVTTSAETGASYGVATNCAASSAHSFANDDSSTYGKYFWMYWGTKNIGVTAITTDSFDDITNITLDFAANDNSKPTITISVVASDESETVILNAGGLKNDFDNPGSDKWKRGKSFAVSNLSGKIKFYLIPSSSGKYAGLDNIVVTYTPAPTTNYTITYDNNGGEGTMNNSTNIVSSCTFTAPTGKEFKEWNTAANGTGASYAPGATAPSNLDLFAIWQDHVAKYTVIYKDGTTELGSETVEVGQHPTGSEIATPTKEFYTFAGWSPALSSVSGNDGDEVEVNATWTGNYAYGTYSFNALTVGSTISKTITDQEVTYADAFRVDNFYFDAGIKIQGETGSAAAGEALDNFIGWKLKTSDKKIRFLVENNCQVKVAIGEKTAIKVTYTPLTGSETTVDQVKDNETPYLVKAGSLVTIKTTSGNTTTLKRLIITNVYNVTYTDTKGDANGSANNVPEVTLPSPTETTVGDYNFTGWIADQAVTVGGVAKAAGTLLSSGVVCELTDNTTFTAQWQLIADFDVKFFQGYGDPDVQIGETQSISTGNNAVAPADPTREGYIFRGWSYDATEANIVDVATYAIAEATNFTAIWSLAYTITHSAAENGTYTIKVGDAEAVDANTAAYAGQTITLAASPSSGYKFSSWTVMNGETPVEVSNNQFTMPAANVTVSATFEVKPSVNDLVTIADDWTFTPSATIAAGTLAEDNKLFASGENDCDYNNGMRIKENRALAFKLNSGAKVKITFSENGDRKMKLGTAMTGDASSVYGISNTSPVVFNVTADGVVYLTTTSDLRFSKMEIIYPHTVTYDLNGGTGTTPTQDASYVGTEITIASSTAFEKVGYNFTGWLCNIDSQVKAANAPYTMTAANTTFTAQWEAINYAVTLAAGTNATTDGVANIDYDAAALVITTAPKGTGTLLGFYTATTASDETKVANADGTLVNDDVTGYVTDGKWSCTSAATLYAVYDGVPTALDNTADEIKAVKFFENGQLFIEKNGHVYNVFGACIK